MQTSREQAVESGACLRAKFKGIWELHDEASSAAVQVFLVSPASQTREEEISLNPRMSSSPGSDNVGK
jgi:hypothetical protein